MILTMLRVQLLVHNSTCASLTGTWSHCFQWMGDTKRENEMKVSTKRQTSMKMKKARTKGMMS